MRYISKVFLSLCLLLGVAAVTANAQVASDAMIETNIPHSFVVGDTTLPAGKYMITAPEGFDSPVLEVRSEDGRHAVMFDTESAQLNRIPKNNELVFDKVGNTYFLSQIFVEGDSTGSQVTESRMERKLVGNGITPEQESVAANRVSRKSAKNR